MALKTVRHIKTKGALAAVDNKDVSIPSNKTVFIKAIDYTAPANQAAGCSVFLDPSGSNTRVSASQGDKYVSYPEPGIEINGPKDIRLQLDNSSNPNGALLGVVVYYEEL